MSLQERLVRLTGDDELFVPLLGVALLNGEVEPSPGDFERDEGGEVRRWVAAGEPLEVLDRQVRHAIVAEAAGELQVRLRGRGGRGEQAGGQGGKDDGPGRHVGRSPGNRGVSELCGRT